MNIKKPSLLAVALFTAISLATSAQALIISTNGGSIISAPSSTAQDASEGNFQQGFNENQGIVLASDLSVDGGIIAAGTKVNSHFIFLDTVGTQTIYSSAKWTFDGEILGIMSDINGTLEAASNSILALAGTSYFQFNNRGFETNNTDSYIVNGNVLDLEMAANTAGDWIRVVTRVPDSSSTAILMGFSFLGLVGLRKRLSR